jgi:DNA invertase Pin-like site-specific DNA recombinase
MSDDPQIPVAQYLRIASEHQKYSLHNQELEIEKYADKHGFSVGHRYQVVLRG